MICSELKWEKIKQTHHAYFYSLLSQIKGKEKVVETIELRAYAMMRSLVYKFVSQYD
jgi:hypothetical protein